MGEITCEGSHQPLFAYTDAQFQSLCAQLRERGDPTFKVLRYRGLASINPSALEALCINAATRHTRLLSAADAEMAMEVFGSERVLPPQQPFL